MDAVQVGALVRNASPLLDAPANPRVGRVLAAYEQAGRELATGGRITWRTQQTANQELVPIPGFALLKRLPFMKPLIARETQRFYSTPSSP
jgi:hypothetical protein